MPQPDEERRRAERPYGPGAPAGPTYESLKTYATALGVNLNAIIGRQGEYWTITGSDLYFTLDELADALDNIASEQSARGSVLTVGVTPPQQQRGGKTDDRAAVTAYVRTWLEKSVSEGREKGKLPIVVPQSAVDQVVDDFLQQVNARGFGGRALELARNTFYVGGGGEPVILGLTDPARDVGGPVLLRAAPVAQRLVAEQDPDEAWNVFLQQQSPALTPAGRSFLVKQKDKAIAAWQRMAGQHPVLADLRFDEFLKVAESTVNKLTGEAAAFLAPPKEEPITKDRVQQALLRRLAESGQLMGQISNELFDEVQARSRAAYEQWQVAVAQANALGQEPPSMDAFVEKAVATMPDEQEIKRRKQDTETRFIILSGERPPVRGEQATDRQVLLAQAYERAKVSYELSRAKGETKDFDAFATEELAKVPTEAQITQQVEARFGQLPPSRTELGRAVTPEELGRLSPQSAFNQRQREMLQKRVGELEAQGTLRPDERDELSMARLGLSNLQAASVADPFAGGIGGIAAAALVGLEEREVLAGRAFAKYWNNLDEATRAALAPELGEDPERPLDETTALAALKRTVGKATDLYAAFLPEPKGGVTPGLGGLPSAQAKAQQTTSFFAAQLLRMRLNQGQEETRRFQREQQQAAEEEERRRREEERRLSQAATPRVRQVIT